MTTTNDQLARQLDNLSLLVSAQRAEHAVLQERVDTNARLAADERQSVRLKIAEVQRSMGELTKTAEATNDTITAFVHKVEGGRLVARWGWIGLTSIGGAALGLWSVWPKLAALFVR